MKSKPGDRPATLDRPADPIALPIAPLKILFKTLRILWDSMV